ncbi:hypothetical protein [Synechococcus phage S-B68]|nr:hypothetical protein [Synechococcus phage S-B68]
MTLHRVKIWTGGVNPFEEEINALTTTEARRIAEARYPGYKTQWMGQAGTKVEPKAPTYNPQTLPERVDAPAATQVNHNGGNAVTDAAGAVAGAGLIGGGFIVMLAIGTLVFLFPVFGAWTGAKVGGKVGAAAGAPKGLNILLALLLGAGGGAGAFNLQAQYMPEIAAEQTAAVEYVRDAIADRF